MCRACTVFVWCYRNEDVVVGLWTVAVRPALYLKKLLPVGSDGAYDWNLGRTYTCDTLLLIAARVVVELAPGKTTTTRECR